MLNRHKFNNLVISNKKHIQQARTQTINKLVHKIRNLKSKLDKTKEGHDDSKFKHRLNKTTVCLEQLKKMKVLEMVQRVLLFDKNPTAILTNGDAMPEEMITAMLASNSKIIEITGRLKEEFNLQSDHDQWKDEIMETSKRRAKINRTEEKRRQRQELKANKVMDKNREAWLQTNQTQIQNEEVEEDEQEAEDEEEEVDEEEEEELTAAVTPALGEFEVEKVSKINKIKEKKKTPEAPASDCKDKQQRKRERTKSESEIPPKKELRKGPVPQIDEEQPLSAPRQSKLPKRPIQIKPTVDEELRMPSPTKTQPPKKREVQKPKEVVKVVDPFFFTDTGEPYLSTAIVAPPTDKKETDDWNNDAYRPPAHQHTATPYPGRGREGPNPSEDNKDHEMSIENLHPSWAAKQKMKPTITAFQGKKITFDD